jgi:hypothetical protein
MSYDSKYNNFFLYFPDCMYRFMEGHSKTCQDLDKILAETNFDMKKFNEINGRITHQLKRTIDLFKKSSVKPLVPEEEKEMKKLFEENEKDIQLFDELVEPAYTAMRKLGYSHEDLWR